MKRTDMQKAAVAAVDAVDDEIALEMFALALARLIQRLAPGNSERQIGYLQRIADEHGVELTR